MKKIDRFIKKLAVHQAKKVSGQIADPRASLLVTSGIHLNWLGDFFGNPEIKWQEKNVPLEKIKFTGTNPEWNKILLDNCDRSPKKLQALIKRNPKIKKVFNQKSYSANQPVVLRQDLENKGYYKVLDGMHRMVAATISGKSKVKCLVCTNEEKVLPICESHVVYDLMRGFIRSAKDKQGEKELYHALKLLSRTYANVTPLLRGRLGKKWVLDKDVQKIIKRVLK